MSDPTPAGPAKPALTAEAPLRDGSGLSREEENRLDALVNGRGPLYLSERSMAALVDSLEGGPYDGAFGVYGPDVYTEIDFDADGHPDRALTMSDNTNSRSGAVYVRQPDGAFKSVGRVEFGTRFAVCSESGSGAVYVWAQRGGWNDDGTVLHRSRGYGARLRVTADTLTVEDEYEMPSDPAPSEAGVIRARLAEYERLATEPRGGCSV